MMPSSELKSINFLTLHEEKTDRVKGLSFHPVRPWLLVSLKNGEIQIWDYRVGVLVDTYSEHLGPVRCVAFHPYLPLFVSGGDDFKVKVWNHREKRCVFNFLEHTDYIRTVSFHHEHPWVLSASDDCTIRISNWQSRQAVTVFVGHNHYVMCAQFHPTEDFVISSSLDGTIRLWDISAIKRKSVSPMSGIESSIIGLQNELLGNYDVQLKFVIENDINAGVNWVTFHPENQTIISGSDDRQVKLWHYTDSRTYELNSFFGHYNNVTCCIFHRHSNCIISCAEDKTIRFWDSNSSQCIYTHRTDNSRFWILAGHPELDLFAAGHDSGFIVFKLRHERPAYFPVLNGDDGYQRVIYITSNNTTLSEYNFVTAKSTAIMSSLRSESTPRWIKVNLTGNLILVVHDGNSAGGNAYYDLYTTDGPSQQYRHKAGSYPCWITHNLYATLDKRANKISLHNETTEVLKKYDFPTPGTIESIFSASQGLLLVNLSSKLALFDLQSSQIVASCDISITNLTFVHFSARNSSYVTLITKKNAYLLDSKLTLISVISERTKIKSALWTLDDVFLYTTMTHIKYLLPNGDSGVIRTLEQVIYLTGYMDGRIFCLDRHDNNRVISVDTSEFQLKNAIRHRDRSKILALVKQGGIIGQAIVNYLHIKGYPELAFYFARDESMRFRLALEFGNLNEALRSAHTLNRTDVWNLLASTAMTLGAPAIAEIAYQKSFNHEKLAFLYLITGQLESLGKLGCTALNSNRIQCSFQISMLLGSVEDRVQMLEKTGQIPLAYIAAELNGLELEASRLKHIYQSQRKHLNSTLPHVTNTTASNDDEDYFSKLSNWKQSFTTPDDPMKPLKVPNPTCVASNFSWPLLSAGDDPFDMLLSNKLSSLSIPIDQDVQYTENPEWNDEQESASQDDSSGSELLKDNQWDLNIDVSDIPIKQQQATIELPDSQANYLHQSALSSELAGEHVAAGSFESAAKLLRQQICVIDFEPLKSHFIKLAMNSCCQLNLWPGNSLEMALPNSFYDGVLVALKLENLVKTLHSAYRAFTSGAFQDSLKLFQSILESIPLLVLSSEKEANEVQDLIAISAEYSLGLQMEMKRKSELLLKNPELTRLMSLATYLTHLRLQGFHIQLTLKSAMNFAKKLKCYGMAHKFGNRLLQMNLKPDAVGSTEKLMQFCEENALADAFDITYDEKNPFRICAADYIPIYKGTPSTSCPYCRSCYSKNYDLQLCKICKISRIGGNATGLVLVRPLSKKNVTTQDFTFTTNNSR